jgi:hypothetical protein
MRPKTVMPIAILSILSACMSTPDIVIITDAPDASASPEAGQRERTVLAPLPAPTAADAETQSFHPSSAPPRCPSAPPLGTSLCCGAVPCVGDGCRSSCAECLACLGAFCCANDNHRHAIRCEWSPVACDR